MGGNGWFTSWSKARERPSRVMPSFWAFFCCFLLLFFRSLSLSCFLPVSLPGRGLDSNLNHHHNNKKSPWEGTRNQHQTRPPSVATLIWFPIPPAKLIQSVDSNGFSTDSNCLLQPALRFYIAECRWNDFKRDAAFLRDWLPFRPRTMLQQHTEQQDTLLRWWWWQWNIGQSDCLLRMSIPWLERFWRHCLRSSGWVLHILAHT